jgi:hypothetical protein
VTTETGADMNDAGADADLAGLLADTEAGVADVLRAHDYAERYYAAALVTTPITSVVTYSTNTSPTPE